jgi:hypothetical protein
MTESEKATCVKCGMPLAYDRFITSTVSAPSELCLECRGETGGSKPQRPPPWLLDLILRLSTKPATAIRLAAKLGAVLPNGKLRSLSGIISSVPRRSSTSQYDGLILYSGGKDSTYMLMQLANKGLRLCAWMLNQGYQSPTAIQNAELVCRQLGVPLVVDRPDQSEMNELFRLGFSIDREQEPQLVRSAMTYGSACWPCFATIAARASRFLAEKEIPLCFIGTQQGQNRLDLNGKPVLEVSELPRVEILATKFVDKLAAHASAQELKSAQLLSMTKPHTVLLPFYEFVDKPPVSEQITAISAIGWKMPKNTGACSSNCMINELGRHVMRKRFGFDLYQVIDAHERRISGKPLSAGETAAPLDAQAVALGAKLINLSDAERRTWDLQGIDHAKPQ